MRLKRAKIMKTVKILAIFLGITSLINAMEKPAKPTTYFELLPAEIGREIQAYDAMNKLEKISSIPANRQNALDILTAIKNSNPQLLNNKEFVYGFLNKFNEKFNIIPTPDLLSSLESIPALQWFKDYSLLNSVVWGNKDTILKLLNEGANINTHVKGDLPLLHVLRPRDIETFKLLIAKGADVNLTDKYGRSALMMAVLDMNPEAVKILLEHHANPNTKDVGGGTALTYVSSAIRELTRYGADAIPDGIKDIKEIISALIAAGFDIKSRNKEGKPVLQQMNDAWNYYKKDYPADKYPEQAAAFNQIFPEIIAFLKSKGAE